MDKTTLKEPRHWAQIRKNRERCLLSTIQIAWLGQYMTTVRVAISRKFISSSRYSRQTKWLHRNCSRELITKSPLLSLKIKVTPYMQTTLLKYLGAKITSICSKVFSIRQLKTMTKEDLHLLSSKVKMHQNLKATIQEVWVTQARSRSEPPSPDLTSRDPWMALKCSKAIQTKSCLTKK